MWADNVAMVFNSSEIYNVISIIEEVRKETGLTLNKDIEKTELMWITPRTKAINFQTTIK